jgi:antitoxin HigA-1
MSRKLRTLRNVHPGEVLGLDFLEAMGITPYRLAMDIGVGRTRVEQILDGKRSITPDTALRLSRCFGTSAQLWLNLQHQYDLEETVRARSAEYEQIPLATALR